MVKVGFIVEGASEKIIIESEQFKSFLNLHDYQLITPVIDAKGGGNLLPQNLNEFLERLANKGIEHIFVLTDLEDETDIAMVRNRVAHPQVSYTFIAVKALEAWYLADSAAMQKWLKIKQFYQDYPEQTDSKPWDKLKEIAKSHNQRGPGNKTAFAKRMVKHWDFTVENAAKHQNCPSVRELVNHFTRSK